MMATPPGRDEGTASLAAKDRGQRPVGIVRPRGAAIILPQVA
jgi:hypothetical protein